MCCRIQSRREYNPFHNALDTSKKPSIKLIKFFPEWPVKIFSQSNTSSGDLVEVVEGESSRTRYRTALTWTSLIHWLDLKFMLHTRTFPLLSWIWRPNLPFWRPFQLFTTALSSHKSFTVYKHIFRWPSRSGGTRESNEVSHSVHVLVNPLTWSKVLWDRMNQISKSFHRFECS